MGSTGTTGESWVEQLRAHGLRLTTQRRLVLESLATLGHATPEAIRAEAGDQVNLSTVYRTLELLEELGLVRHTHLGHGSPSYSVAREIDHLHLVCHTCQRVLEADSSLLGGLAKRLAQQGFALDLGHVALFGQCDSCQSP